MDIVLGEGDGDGGIPHGRLLVRFADAALGDDPSQLDRVRDEVSEAVGETGMVDAAAVIGCFEGIDRVADATGIPIDEERLAPTADLRDRLGVNSFPSAAEKGSD